MPGLFVKCLILPFLWCTLACQKAQLPVPHGPTKNQLPLVFIHGLMGSELVDSSGELHWLTATQGLGLSTPTLNLPLTFQAGIQQRDRLRPRKPLGSVQLLPGLGLDVYGPWLKYASRILTYNLHNFTYDWRRDNNENARNFLDYLQWIHARYGKPARVVAHSMGGMISLAVLNKRPDLIERIVFAGVPFRGGIGYLDNMYLGTPTGLNSSILSAKTIFSHTSVYSFYPAGQAFENRNLLRDSKEQPVSIDYYSLSDWRRLGLGPFAIQNDAWFRPLANQQKYINFLDYALRRGKIFRLAMKPTQKHYPHTLVITGKTHPTLDYGRQIEPQTRGATPGWDFETTPRLPGDGKVTYPDSLPPQPIQYIEFLSDNEHTYLLNDQKVQKRITQFLIE